MPRLTQVERYAFLDERRVIMRIALTRADGGPFVTPLWFLCQDGAVRRLGTIAPLIKFPNVSNELSDGLPKVTDFLKQRSCQNPYLFQ